MTDNATTTTTTGPPALQQGEVELTDPDELYQRQCHPSFMKDGLPTSQLFNDFPKDKGKLSGTRDSVVHAAQSYMNHQAQGLPTEGTWAVSVAEVTDNGSRVVDDVQSADAPDPCPTGHAYLDYRLVHKPGKKRFRNALIIKARQRGRLYPQPGSTQLAVSLEDV